MSADRAFDLEARVIAARAVERRTWVMLAEQLAAFHVARAWEALGWERFADWLGSPEVGLGRRQAYRLVQAWVWAESAGVPPVALERVELSKLAVVLPAVKENRVSAQEALSDAEMLSRSDLIQKYTQSRERDAQSVTEVSTELCPDCGCERVVG